MTRWRLLRALLWHDRRAHLGVMLGAMIAAASLVGALSLGDSLALSLRKMALQRLGQSVHALHSPNRFFRAELAGMLADGATAPAILVNATASDPAAGNGVSTQLLGVDERFWRLGSEHVSLGRDEVALNRHLAGQLNADVGDTLVLRFDKPGELPADAVLGDLEDRRGAMRMRVSAIVPDENLGRFGLQPTQQPLANAFVSLSALASVMGRPGGSNLLLVSETGYDAARLDEELAEHWRLVDVGLTVFELDQAEDTDQASGAPGGSGERGMTGSRGYQLQSRGVYIPTHVRRKIENQLGGEAVLAHLANELKIGDRRVPYAVVAAADIGDHETGDDRTIWLNEWVAAEADLAANVGDRLRMRYFVESAERRLVEHEAVFRVGRIVPMDHFYMDRRLMPPWPGIADVEHHADWSPGVAIDLSRVRDRDETYWELHRGTPKALVSLETGRELWANRFGDCTAMRWAADDFASVDDARHQIRAALSPVDFGLTFVDVRRQALEAAERGPARYFGGLFVGLSLSLILAAVILTGVLFAFGIEQRSRQIGLLLAVGFTSGQVHRLLAVEGAVLSALGTAAGVGVGLLYTNMLLLGLGSLWAEAVGHTPIEFATSLSSMLGGSLLAGSASLAAVALTARTLVRRQPSALLRGEYERPQQMSAQATRFARLAPGLLSALIVIICLAGVVVFSAWGSESSAEAQAAGFIGAGVCMLIAWLVLTRYWLRRLADQSAADRLTWPGLARRAAARRPGRSLAVVALLSSGLFITLAIGASRHTPPADTERVDGPTGGYQLMVSLNHPLPHRIDQRGDGSADPSWNAGEVLPIRLTQGPEASCDNLNRPTQPRLAGIDTASLARRSAFRFLDSTSADTLHGAPQASPWLLLKQGLGPGVLPAIADQPTLVWALGLGVGDTLSYTDHHGQPLEVRIVGMIESSVLQGLVLVDSQRLLEHYPAIEGFERFLVSADEPDAVARGIRRIHVDRGPEVVPTTQLMHRFQALENTYLSIFLTLGGLGLALGSVGLGVVVLRQVMDRRGELALLRAVGFSRGQLLRSLIIEHTMLAMIALGAGLTAAIFALRQAPAIAWGSLLMVLVIVVASLLAWIVLAGWWATRGTLLEALRSE